mmetsp:Transcript_7611/g.12815  ORF Transcript_7611/g.12815 Transcript_7611/m.12815 type:complete len:232 (+) Transcript_7611:283-978(+)
MSMPAATVPLLWSPFKSSNDTYSTPSISRVTGYTRRQDCRPPLSTRRSASMSRISPKEFNSASPPCSRTASSSGGLPSRIHSVTLFSALFLSLRSFFFTRLELSFPICCRIVSASRTLSSSSHMRSALTVASTPGMSLSATSHRRARHCAAEILISVLGLPKSVTSSTNMSSSRDTSQTFCGSTSCASRHHDSAAAICTSGQASVPSDCRRAMSPMMPKQLNPPWPPQHTR